MQSHDQSVLSRSGRKSEMRDDSGEIMAGARTILCGGNNLLVVLETKKGVEDTAKCFSRENYDRAGCWCILDFYGLLRI